MTKTYLELIKKYPLAMEDVLELRRDKTTGLYIYCSICVFIGFISGIGLSRMFL